jgi:LacI family transcriptional regulator
MKNMNIRQLAKELNLSVSTVSKVFNDSHEISEETKKRVLEVAEKMNYTPNPYASSLRGRKSKTIAVVIPEVADSFFSLAINGIEAIAQDKGYHVLVYLTHESFLKEQAILKDFQSGRVDGILMSISRETLNSDHVKEVIAKEIPMVFFDRICEDIQAAKITTNDYESGYLATKHLAERGCKRIAYLSISSSLAISNNRMRGYKQALKDHSIPFEEDNIVECGNNYLENYNVIKTLMDKKKRPDGIIACVEKFTTPIYIACRDLKLSIPRDVKIISFSNLEPATILNPSLSTITQPAFEIGKAAATILFKSFEKKSFKLELENIVLPSILIARDSTLKIGH